MSEINSLGVYDTHKEWLMDDAGLTDETIQKNGLFSISGSMLKSIGFPTAQSDAIIFPYYDLERNPINGGLPVSFKQIARARLLTPIVTEEGKELRYLSRNDERFDIYLPAGLKELIESESYIIITEGEKKAIAAVQAGIPCIGLCGVWMWHDPSYIRDINHEHYQKKVNNRFHQLLRGKHVIVLADSDAQTNYKVRHAMESLTRALRHQVESMTACQYQNCPSDESGKVGLDDWLKLNHDSVKATIQLWLENKYPWIDLPYREIKWSEHEEKSLYYKLPVLAKSGPQGKVIKQEAVLDRESNEYIIRNRIIEVPLVFLTDIIQVLRVNDLVIQEESPEFPTEEGHLYTGIKPSGMPASFKTTPDAIIVQSKMQSLGVTFPTKKSFEEWISLNYYLSASGTCNIKYATRAKGWMRRLGEPWQYLWGPYSASNLPESERMNTFSVNTNAKASSGVQRKGDYARWQDAFLALMQNPSFAVLAGFACSSLLLSRIKDMEAGIVHIYGDSSHGKSTVQRWLSSLIGSTEKADSEGAYVLSWRTTDNAAESFFYERNDSVVFLDEMHLIPNTVDVYQMMYQIANGGGKKRSTISGENRAPKSWKVQTISSGEISVESAQKSRRHTKESIPGGLEFRVIQLNVGELPFLEEISEVGRTKKWGRYEHLVNMYHPNSDGKDKVKSIINAFDSCFAKNYGFAWERMVKLLLNDGAIESLEGYYHTYVNRINAELASNATNILKRKSKHVAASMTGLAMLLLAMDVEYGSALFNEITTKADDWARNHFWKAGLTRLTGKESDDIVNKFESWVMQNLGRLYVPGASDSTRLTGLIGTCDADVSFDMNNKPDITIHTLHIFQDSIPDAAKTIGVDERRLMTNLIQAGWKKHSLKRDFGGMAGVESRYFSIDIVAIHERQRMKEDLAPIYEKMAETDKPF